MLNKPIKIAFVVKDIIASVAFYTKVLDLEVEATYPEGNRLEDSYVFLKSETIIIELMPKKFMGDTPLGFHHLAFWSDNIAENLGDISKRGGELLSTAFSAGVGGITLGDFKGPEGILLRLFNQKK
ncbi:MAG: VOC family protein [Proteobacteria bacterium]|nr:VOC family protein [Pseudomonadota bacterium]MBU1686785.1 VOC family protein [Pseudomonadota bacterium]